MRLAPVEKPRGALLRLAYRMSARQLGAVMSPLKVLYARAPRLGVLGFHIAHTLEKGLSLDAELRLLIATQSSLQNGCSFCADLHRAQAVRERIGLEKLESLPDFETSPAFDERERAALAFAAEVTRLRRASDETFERLRAHFDEREIVEITWLNAVGNYFNLLAIPLGIESDGLLELALRRVGRSAGGSAGTAGTGGD